MLHILKYIKYLVFTSFSSHEFSNSQHFKKLLLCKSDTNTVSSVMTVEVQLFPPFLSEIAAEGQEIGGRHSGQQLASMPFPSL